MPEAQLEEWFPDIRQAGYQITSEIDLGYNCVAYAAEDQTRWWEPFRPDAYWPDGVALDDTLEGFVVLFESLGFELCDDADTEAGFTKIALYGTTDGDFLHVSRQLPTGYWTSKIGEAEDIEHNTLEALNSVGYGQPLRFMRKRDQ
jgi:hypothetical protein